MEPKGNRTGSEGLQGEVIMLDAHDPALPCFLAALINSGGGVLALRPPESGIAGAVTALKRAAVEIVPSPTVDGAPMASRGTTIVLPPSIRTEKIDLDGAPSLLVQVGGGQSFCTVGGNAYVLENGVVRSLTVTEVVRRAGSGG